MNWAGCADNANSGQAWYNSGLGDLYTKFTNLKAGSSLDVQAAIQDLYKTIKNNTFYNIFNVIMAQISILHF